MSENEAATARRSLLGKGLERWRARARKAPPAAAADRLAISPLPMVRALELLAAACGKDADRARLTAALPVVDGDLAPQFAPLALARTDLAASWRQAGLARLLPGDLPALVRLDAGGALVVLGLGAGRVRFTDAAGTHEADVGLLAPLLSGEVLSCGHLDPVNGMDDEEDRSLLIRNPWLWLAGLYMGEKRALGQMLLAALLVNLCALTIPLYMRAIYDRVVPNLAMESLWALSVGVVLALLFELALRRAKSAFVDHVAVRVGQTVQHRAIAAVLHARVWQTGAKGEGSVGSMLLALRDVEGLAPLVPQALVTFVIDLPSFVAFVALIALIGGWTLAGPVLGAVALLAAGLVTNYALKIAARKQSRLAQARNNLLVELTEGWATIKANMAEGRFLARWDVLSDHIAITSHQQRHWNEVPAMLSGLIVQAVTVLVVVISVFQIKEGAMTSGAMVAVIMLSGRAMGPISAAIATLARLYQSLSQFQGLARILQAAPERRLSDPAIGARAMAGRVRLSGINHMWGEGAPCLANVNIAIEPGERVALIGRSGSGKSTLLQIMAGLLPVQEGLYTIDGHAVDRYAAAALRAGITYAAQDGAIFDSTIWDNILLGLPEPDPALVEAALNNSGLAAHVEHTVEGFMRKAGPQGRALSGGQRQSLLLARALIRNPQVLLLDEPTAAMDIASEQAVIHGLARAAQDKTLVIATHRLALLELVERVIWLEHGRVVADRPRDEVLAMLRRGGGAATQVA